MTSVFFEGEVKKEEKYIEPNPEEAEIESQVHLRNPPVFVPGKHPL